MVEVTCHRSEMGQQIRTAIAQIVADEMEASWEKVIVIQGKGDPKYGDQNTEPNGLKKGSLPQKSKLPPNPL